MTEKFTVVFYDDDRKTILDKQEINKEACVKYEGKTPEKPAENGINYTFIGWETTGDINCVVENIELFAKYEEDSKLETNIVDDLFELTEIVAQESQLNEVMEAGNKVLQVERATRNLTLDQKKALIAEIKEKGSVNLDKQNEKERD